MQGEAKTDEALPPPVDNRWFPLRGVILIGAANCYSCHVIEATYVVCYGR